MIQGSNYSCVAGSGEATLFVATNDKLKALQDDDTNLKVVTEVQLNCEISQITLPSGDLLMAFRLAQVCGLLCLFPR